MHARIHFAAPVPIRHSFKRFTLVDLLVLIAVAAIGSGLLLPDSSNATRRQIEERILGWKPSDADKIKPSSEFVAPEMEISGKWSLRRHLNGNSLRITRLPSGQYDVSFSTGGCLGHFEAERKGELQRGTQSLDKPVVAEYMNAVYDTLYAVRVENVEYLLPAAFVARFQAAISSEGEVIDKSGFNLWVYRRADELP